jgi:hypothetical protein
MIENKIEELLYIYNETLYLNSDLNPEIIQPKGGFEMKILALTEASDLIPDTELLLSKMLAACKFTEKDYYIMNISQSQVLETIHRLQPETVLLFNLTLQSPAFNILKEKNQPFRFAGRKYLLCDSLKSILINPSLKSDLWTNGLKILFNLST